MPYKIKQINSRDIYFSDNLLEIDNCPQNLYYVGNINILNTKAISIVGKRNASAKGKYYAYLLAKKYASQGFTIVSGLAKGIDQFAHIGALAAKGKTIAVLGNGLSKIYPEENTKLAKEIIENKGLIITEYKINDKIKPENFPIRNRIISGLSIATIIIEADETSGSLITAKCAIDQNRELYTIPWKINLQNNKQSGCNLLIKEGINVITKP